MLLAWLRIRVHSVRMRVVVAGSRSITDYKLVTRAIEESQFVITTS